MENISRSRLLLFLVAGAAFVALLAFFLWGIPAERSGAPADSSTSEGDTTSGSPPSDLAQTVFAEGAPRVEVEGIVQDISGGRIVLMLPDESGVFFVRYTNETEFSGFTPKNEIFDAEQDISVGQLVTVRAVIRDGASYADFVRLAE